MLKYDDLLCPNCNCICELTIQNKQHDHLPIIIPVFKCNICEFEWTNHLAEAVIMHYQSKLNREKLNEKSTM